jgi:hypothetical protein
MRTYKPSEITRRDFLKTAGYVAGSALLVGSVSQEAPAQKPEDYSLTCEACKKTLTDKAIASVYGNEISKKSGKSEEDILFLYADQSKIHYACPGEHGIGGDCSSKVDKNNMTCIEVFPGMTGLTGGATISFIDVQEFLKARDLQLNNS